jgi:hypothetical protein
MPDSEGRYSVAIVGLSFGAEFIPIYQEYPFTRLAAICQRTREKLDAVGDTWGVAARYTDYAECLEDPAVEIVHINTPPPLHADMCVAGLEAGKHVASTIPMALTVKDCRRIVDAQEKSGGHGGSHPHLVHEFISALREKREPYPSARQAANITCSGILAHESALKGGALLPLPAWTFIE